MTSAESTLNRNLVLPAEICSIIIQFVQPLSKIDLRNFCRVSRGFRSEAERHLYIDVLLTGIRAVKLWARTVHKRPYLSAKTRRVILYLPRQTQLEADDLGWVVKGLKTCWALEDLRVLEELDHRSPEGKRDHYGNSVHRWILNGHPFKVKSFTNEYFQNHLLNEFLKSQPDLESLCLKGEDDSVIELDDVPLTKVHSMDGTSSATLAYMRDGSNFERKLQHLQVEFRIFSRADITFWRHLPPYVNTLQSLSILETGNSKWGHSFHMLAIHVYEQLPNIRALRILSTKVHGGDSFYDSLSWEYMIPTVFHRLEVLVLRPPTIEPNDEEAEQGLMGQCAYEALRTPITRKAAASGAMTAMSTLKRVDLGTQLEFHRFVKTQHGIEESSVPVEEGCDRHDFDWRSI